MSTQEDATMCESDRLDTEPPIIIFLTLGKLQKKVFLIMAGPLREGGGKPNKITFVGTFFLMLFENKRYFTYV